jgi:hypothetical protein
LVNIFLQNFLNFIYIYIYIILNWAGPDSAPKCVGPISAQQEYGISLLGQTRPRRQGWARIRLAQQPKRAGGIIFPPPLHAERYSFCMQRRKNKSKNEGEEELPGAGRRWLAAFLAVLWRRPVAVSWLTDGGSKRRCCDLLPPPCCFGTASSLCFLCSFCQQRSSLSMVASWRCWCCWRLVAVSWLTDGGSKQRQRCYFFSVFP